MAGATWEGFKKGSEAKGPSGSLIITGSALNRSTKNTSEGDEAPVDELNSQDLGEESYPPNHQRQLTRTKSDPH